MMGEIWRSIPGFSSYEVSNCGRIRNLDGRILSTSDDGNGYQKLMLYSDDGYRYCKKVHRIVAEVFLSKPTGIDDLTVDHIKSGADGKLDNSVYNLRWISRSENIKKAYRDGVCDDRINSQRKTIRCVNLWTYDELYYSSISEASEDLGIDRSAISHVLRGDIERTSHYVFEYVVGKERLLYDSDEFKADQYISRL